MIEPREGLILLNKPTGVTSFQALRPVKKLVPKGTKVGHTGTLDQFATGVLPILVGKATRLVRIFSEFDKSYRGTIRFGEETETLDTESEVRRVGEPPDRRTLEEAIHSFVGPIEQVPPAYSAVHIDGERAYRRVRRGEVVQVPARKVTIYSLELLSYEPPDAVVTARCSKGTYIRALARDIAESCGTGAYLRALSRTGVGPYTLSETVDHVDEGSFHTLESIVDRLPNISSVSISETLAKRISHGAKLRNLVSWEGGTPYIALRTEAGALVAIADESFNYILVR